jgi:hypothetical protein
MIQLEIQEIEEHISLDGADKRWWDFRELFRLVTCTFLVERVC